VIIRNLHHSKLTIQYSTRLLPDKRSLAMIVNTEILASVTQFHYTLVAVQ